MNGSSLLVGIGSPYGDDRVGWEIARCVESLAGGSITVRCARAPADVLDWLEGIDRLEICDALSGGAEVGRVYCWRWPAPEIECVRFHTSHDFSLPAVLALAESLGRLPRQVRIWGVGVEPEGALESLSPSAAAAITSVADRIFGACSNA